jgi:hypothetical protein
MKRWMKHLMRMLAILAVRGMGSAVMVGCEDEGPMEEAGENIDEAGEEVQDAGEEMGDEIEEATD